MAKIDFKENGSPRVENLDNPTHGQKEQPTTKTIGELGETIRLLDCFAQDGFSKISAIAKLARRSLENPEGHQQIGDVFSALEVIAHTADEYENTIGYEAESAGFNYNKESLRNFQMAAREFGISLKGQK